MLEKYKKKRDFSKTPEPKAKKSKVAKGLAFCVQKHHASHLHYDVRLEYKGILLSWAVPKGPSLNPADKRLAVHVEDHPLSYQHFEGVIPKGNYGAGTVEIWDKGTYRTVVGETRKEMEKYMKEGLAKGHFAVILSGKRLVGEFIFLKLKKDEAEDKNWLMIKKREA